MSKASVIRSTTEKMQILGTYKPEFDDLIARYAEMLEKYSKFVKKVKGEDDISTKSAAETGLTLDDLGFATSNPTSADAIKASHETLRLTARKAQKVFGRCFLNAGYLAACVRDQYSYERKQMYLTHATWNPIFEPDASQLGTLGDAVLKIEQARPGYLDEDKIHELMGM